MHTDSTQRSVAPADEEDSIGLIDLARLLAASWKLLLIGPLLAGAAAYGLTYAITPTFEAKTVFLPPQQQQSSALSAISQLGALSGLAGASLGVKSPADQYVALLQSTTVADRMIDEFKLQEVYDVEYRFRAREALARNVRIVLGKKDGLITVEVEDASAQRAADMANRYVDELRLLTNRLALTEAQQRRVFFEKQLVQSRDDLAKSQNAL
jgi:capsular polysaccharide biosynthesis protein